MWNITTLKHLYRSKPTKLLVKLYKPLGKYFLFTGPFKKLKFGLQSHGPNFIKPVSTKNLLSTEKYCLTDYQITSQSTLSLHCGDWCSTHFVFAIKAKKFLKRCFLLNSFMKLSPVFNKALFQKNWLGPEARFVLHAKAKRIFVHYTWKNGAYRLWRSPVRTGLSPEPKPNSFLKGKCNKCCQIYLNLEKNSQICRVGFWLNLLQAPLYDVSIICHRIYRCCSILNLE